MTDKTLVIYHQDCADGHTAAWVADKALGGNVQLLPAKYGDPAPDVTGRTVMVLDFSYKRPEMLRMIEQATHVIVLDHHKTAQAELDGLHGSRTNEQINGRGVTSPHIVFDMEKSGAMLTWDYFYHDDPAPLLVQYVQDRDLWKWEMTASQEINAAISSCDKTFANWDLLHKAFGNVAEQQHIYQQGLGILRYQGQLIERAVENCWEETIAGHKVRVVNCTEASLISAVAGRLADGRPFGACFFVNHKGERCFSLRSRQGGIDVSEVARSFGGGGHKAAAGFKQAPGQTL
jgi:oligoribonuclease NrnB/cAMP/cGMP phosphodiesterase (DHH superfamily)